MELQRSFTPDYTEKLKYDARMGFSTEKYALSNFPLDDAETIALKGIEKPEGLLEKLVPEQKYDLQNAITIYEAFPDLSPLIAASEPFWAYLTHADLFDFVQKRWANVKSKDVSSQYILDHWLFGQHGRWGNAFAAGWWHVAMTIDTDRQDKYELTKVLYSNSDLVSSLAGSKHFSNSALIHSILSFYADHPELNDGSIIKKNRCIIQFFNRLGGVQNLSYMDEEFYKSILNKNLDIVSQINSNSEVSEFISKIVL